LIRLHVLGPVEASADGRPVALGGAKPRAVLAMLALEANRTVSADRLVEGLWGELPPASAAKMVQTYVWRLRTALGDDDGLRILTRGRGYELRIEPEAVDVCRLERLLALASRPSRPAGEETPPAMRSRCGVVRRSRTWPTSPSRRRRSAGWRSFASRRRSSP
jgi:DNA-binding SARP family transcriptional activator